MAGCIDFDVAAAHRYFAAHCFNQAWDLIEKKERTPAEDQLMVALNQASIYHWQQRADCTSQNISIGYWQASRIQVVLGNAAEAIRHARICLSYSSSLAPFYLGYAHEALARSYRMAGELDNALQHLALATAMAEQVTERHDRELLVADLATIQTMA
ncbi:hypothetical protein [Schlesneria sp. T3-172]|uniref:hypothetical protein n=1 Tax=Schlesneria sphaerica TaxID=3373610 RepID=UPI0037CC0944